MSRQSVLLKDLTIGAGDKTVPQQALVAILKNDLLPNFIEVTSASNFLFNTYLVMR